MTGEILPAVKIGTFAPNSGNPTNGIQVFDEGVLEHAADSGGAAHRLLVGRDRRRPDRRSRRLRRVPGSLQRRHHPAARRAAAARQHADGQLHDDPRAAVDAAQPEPGDGARRSNPDYKPQYIYNYSIGVQRDLGWKLVARRRLRRLEGPPAAADAQHQRRAVRRRTSSPSSIDPTTGGPLPANFLRPYRGYGDILVSEFAGFSDYDALQTR